MATKKNAPQQQRPRDPDEYPHQVQRAGEPAMRLFDKVIAGLISDGYTPQEADMLAHINLDQILAAARGEAPTNDEEEQ